MKLGRTTLIGIAIIAIIVVAGAYYYYSSIYLPGEEAKQVEIDDWMDWANTLIVAVNDEDPTPSIMEGWGIGNMIVHLTSNNLWGAYGDGPVYNQLAESFERKTIDGKPVLDVYMRDGLHWQDGSPVTAYDVKRSWDYEANIEGVQPYASRHRLLYTNTNNTEVIDELTFRIWLSSELAWNPDLHETFGGAAGEIAQIDSLDRYKRGEPDPRTGIVKDVGCGPFEITEWVSGEKAVLTRWDDFQTPGVGCWVEGMGKSKG